MSFIPFVPGQILTAAELNAALAATIGPYLPLVGGEVTGGTLFSGAGTGLAVTNNATIGGTLGVAGLGTFSKASGTGLAVTSNTTIGGSLGVSGATTLTSLAATAGAFSGAITVTNAGPAGLTVQNTGNNGTTGYADVTIKTTGASGSGLGPAVTLDATSLGGRKVFFLTAGPGDGGGLATGTTAIFDNALGRLLSFPSNGSGTMRYGLWLGEGITKTWSGSGLTPPNTALTSSALWTGTVPATGNDVGAHFFNTSDTIDASGAVSFSQIVAQHVFGTGSKGDRVGAYFKLFQGATSLNTNGFYTAETAWFRSASNDSGTAQTQTGVAGTGWGRVTLAQLLSTSTYWRALNGHEIDIVMAMPQGQAPLERTGLKIVNLAGNTSYGAVIDSAFFVAGASGSAAQFHYGFAVGAANAISSIDSNGIAFGIDASQNGIGATGYVAANNTMGWLLDGREGRYNGGLVRGPSFQIGAGGQIVTGPLVVSSSAGATAIDASQFQGPSVGTTFSGGTLTSGGTGIQRGMRLTDVFGGTYTVSLAPSGAATEITVYARASDTVTRSGSVTLTPDAMAVSLGAGGTITVTQTWVAPTTITIGGTVATAVNIGRAAGATGIYGATAVTKQTVTGSRGGNAALASLLTALATWGVITDSSS